MFRLSHRFVAIRSAAASPVGEREVDAPPLDSPTILLKAERPSQVEAYDWKIRNRTHPDLSERLISAILAKNIVAIAENLCYIFRN
jgi:hypothetical protein